MNILSRIINWYFSRNALPYWCILLIDYIIIIFSGFLAYYLFYGGDKVVGNFWEVLGDISLLLIPYTIAFRLFHTYSGIFRYSSFVDLTRIGLAMTAGSAAAYLVYLCIPDKMNIFLEYPTLLVLLLLFSTTFMCALRITVKTLYDLFRNDGATKGHALSCP